MTFPVTFSVWQIGPRHGKPAEVLINHAQYNETIFSRHFVNDTIRIVPFREPVAWMKSAVKFFKKLGVIKEVRLVGVTSLSTGLILPLNQFQRGTALLEQILNIFVFCPFCDLNSIF